MTVYILIVLIVAKIVVLSVTGAILYKVLGPELRAPKPTNPMPGVRCLYCHATPSLFHSEETRWEGSDLVIVRTYECRQCHMPFWRLERVKALEKEPS